MKLFYLMCYAAITVGITIHSIYKKKSAIYTALWIGNAVSAIFCVLCKIFHSTLVGNGIMQNRWYDLSDTTLHGYLLIIICNLFAYIPFNDFDRKSLLAEFGHGKGKKQFFILFSMGYIILALVFALLSINTIKDILGTSDFGLLRSTLYGNSENESEFIMTTNFLANICYKLCLQFKYLNVFVALIMIKERFAQRLAILSLLMTFFVYFLYATGNAARGGLLIFTVCSVLIGWSLLKYMSVGNKRKVLLYGSIVFGIVLVFFITVTVSRFGNAMHGGNPVLRSISFYLGHGPIEFSKITGSLKEFAYGKTIIGRLLNHYFGSPYSWNEIQNLIGYPPIGAVFVTYLGYIYTDFGSVGCLLFVILWSRFMSTLIRKSPNRISTMFLFFYYLSFYVTGIFVVGRLEYAAMITSHVIFLGIRFVEDFLRSRSRVIDYRIDGRSFIN